MLQLTSAGKRFGPRILFEDANWLITPDERTALVGANGTGKSTLMKVLADLDSLDYGTLERPGMPSAICRRMASRSPAVPFSKSVSRSLTSSAPLSRNLRPLRFTRPSSTRSPAYEAAAERFSQLGSRFRAHDGYTLDAQVGAVPRWPRLQQGRLAAQDARSSPAAGRCASRSRNSFCRSPVCCCSTSPPTISISRRATGSKTICTTIPTATSSSRTIATSSTSPSPR